MDMLYVSTQSTLHGCKHAEPKYIMFATLFFLGHVTSSVTSPANEQFCYKWSHETVCNLECKM